MCDDFRFLWICTSLLGTKTSLYSSLSNNYYGKRVQSLFQDPPLAAYKTTRIGFAFYSNLARQLILSAMAEGSS